MITKYVLEHECMSSILLFGLVSLLLQAAMVMSLKGYVRASANMKTTKKKIMINLKNQFETIYGMGYQVRNTAAYVDKYLIKLRFMGVSYSAWEKAPFLAAGLVTLIAGVEAFYEYMTKAPMALLVEILFSYGVVLVCFFVFFHIFGVKSKKQQMQIQLVDYLENYLANRLLREKDEVKVLDEQMENAFMEGNAKNPDLKRVILEEERQQRESAIASTTETEEEEDMKMLKRLLQEKTVTHEDAGEEEKGEASEVSDVDLLEEFVQSFLA